VNICGSCGGEAGLAFETKDVNRRVSSQPFAFYRCSGCGLLFLQPVPANLHEYYPASYQGRPPTGRQLRKAADAERYKIELVRQFKSGGSLLEIGSSWGTFAFLASEAGFEVTALEMDQSCCAYLNEVLNVKSICSPDPAHALSSVAGEFDVVAMWQNLEHLPEGWKAFAAAARALKPAGILLVAAPNPDAFQFRVFGRAWTHIDAPRHVMLIPISTLLDWGRASGLDPVLVTTNDPGAQGWNSFGWRESLANWVPGRLLKIPVRWIGSALAWVFATLDRREGRGSTYTVVFERTS
jgi:SAM-dependent methyltransferase